MIALSVIPCVQRIVLFRGPLFSFPSIPFSFPSLFFSFPRRREPRVYRPLVSRVHGDDKKNSGDDIENAPYSSHSRAYSSHSRAGGNPECTGHWFPVFTRMTKKLMMIACYNQGKFRPNIESFNNWDNLDALLICFSSRRFISLPNSLPNSFA